MYVVAIESIVPTSRVQRGPSAHATIMGALGGGGGDRINIIIGHNLVQPNK